MRTSRTTVLEIGAAHVAVAVFAPGADGALSLRAATEERHSADPALEAGWFERTATALKNVAKKIRARGATHLVVPGHLVLTKHVRVPAVAAAKRAQVIPFEASQAIPWPLAEVAWEHELIADDGRVMELRFTAIKLEPLAQLCAAAQAAGFHVRGVMTPGEALWRAFRYTHPEARETVLVADIGARSTILVIGDPARYQARILGSAGNDVTVAVGEEFLLSFAEAEAMKRRDAAEGFNTGDGYFPLTTKTGRKIVGQWQREIARFAASYSMQAGAQVSGPLYLTGGGSLLAGLREMLGEKHNPRVEHFDPLRRVVRAARVKTGATAPSAEFMANLVGLASAVLDDRQTGWALLPPVSRTEWEIRRRQPYLLATAALLAAALLPPLWHFHRLAQHAAIRLADVEARLQPQQELAARNAVALGRVGQLQAQIAQARRLVEAKSTWTTFFADVQKRLETIEDVWLDRLMVAPAVAVTRAGKNGESKTSTEIGLTIGGRLLDAENPVSKVSAESYERVKRLLASFADSPFVAAVRDERFDNTQPGILRFDVTLVIAPGHPL